MNTFQITSSLSQVYPDIEGELCSKHTVLLNEIHKGYSNAFPMHPPTHYVVSKNIIQLIKTQKSSISMALEQGTVIILSDGEEGGQLYISASFLKEDLVFQGSGKSLNSQAQDNLAIAMESIIECATEDLSLHRMNGGFIYINCFDSPNDEGIRNSLLIGLFMSILTLNNLLDEYSEEELIAKLKQNKHLKSCNVESYFACCNNRELLVEGLQVRRIKLENKYKLIFLALDFALQNFYYENSCQDYEELIGQGQLGILDLFTAIQQKQVSEVKEVIGKIKEELKIKTFILCQKYAIFLVQSYRYAQLIGKISKMVHKIQQSKQPKQDDGRLVKRFSSATKISSILFSSVPSQPLSILDPSSCLWFN